MKRNLALLAIMLLLPLSSFAQYSLLGQGRTKRERPSKAHNYVCIKTVSWRDWHNQMPKENTVSETCHEAATRWWQVVSAILLTRIRS